MSQHKDTIYRSWVPYQIKLPLLVIGLFPQIMLMSLFHSNSTFSASFLGIEPEDVQYLLSLMYGSVVVTLMIFSRLFAYFRVRSYIILMCSISVFILLLMAFIKDFNTLRILRILEGIFGVLEGACFLPLIVAQLKTRHASMIAYLFLFTTMLTGGTLTTTIAKSAIADYGWREMIYLFVAFHLVMLFIVTVLFNRNRLIPKLHLYQFDFASCLFLLIAIHCGSYALLYGYKLYWFNSPQIIITFILFLVFSGLFILKQTLVKRPIFQFSIIRYKNVVLGILLFSIFYILRSGLNNVYSTMSVVWQWPWEYVLNVQYINVAGTLLGVISSAYLLTKNVQSKIIFGIGFLLFAIDCAWFTFVFSPNVNHLTVGAPLFLQGIAQGWLITPLVMYLITGLPTNLAGNGVHVGASVRFWTTNIGFAVMQNASSFFNKLHYCYLQQNIVSNSSTVQQVQGSYMRKFLQTHNYQIATVLTNNKLDGIVRKQALLLSNIEIFTWLTGLALLTFILILLMKPSRILFRKLKLRSPFIAG
jgi:MFS family permease